MEYVVIDRGAPPCTIQIYEMNAGDTMILELLSNIYRCVIIDFLTGVVSLFEANGPAFNN